MDTLNTFVLQYNGEIISPQLITIREYGNWLKQFYGEDIARLELYLKAKQDGQLVLEYHPGTKIGNWFDKRVFYNSKYKSWYILDKTPVLQRLKQLKLAEHRDVIPSGVWSENGRRMLRVYTVDQIDIYIRNNIDWSFDIRPYIDIPKLIKCKDLSYIISPGTVEKRKSLF